MMNKLKIKEKMLGRVMDICETKNGKHEVMTVFLPTNNVFANAKVLEVMDNGFFTVHWKDNWNTSGDFRTELMRFDNKAIMDKSDLKERNKIRIANGLIPIE